MHFTRRKNHISSNPDQDVSIKIGETEIPQVSETKFLGVIIDDRLCWDPHITKLRKKLASCAGTLSRIKDNIPQSLHKELYHTLFESHLSYGITVWGGISNNKLLPLFKAQKLCVRIMFGDTEAYLDKFKTCARTRSFGNQKLGQEFFIKEHTKPLITKHKLLSVHNLHYFHCATEAFKILKYHTPISLSALFTISQRPGKDTLLLTPARSDSFVYNSGVALNSARQRLEIADFSISLGSLKSNLKSKILAQQSWGNPQDWLECNTNMLARPS